MSLRESSTIFALDIGTRSIVGLLLKRTEKSYTIIDMISKEHGERAMLDGQIHNVLAVSKLIKEIKEELEKKHGILKKVCVAAAGRSLKTKRGQVEINIAGKTIVEKEDILHLELSAVQQAQFELAQDFADNESFHYYCVGYSVVDYRLDGEVIGSLVDQAGETATVEVIATFLPKVVVESLMAALTRADLDLEALTLEPIAAINVLIPPSMRRLNVALVDIGAGTSDIAITDASTVVAYGMVSIAGDEITEAISDQFLLDFPDADQIKRQLSDQDEITVTDILGFETRYKAAEMIEVIEGAIQQLASAITNEILTLNRRPPKAVMLVGGGSMTPNLATYVAKSLQLPENRVAIRGIDAIKNLELPTAIKPSPELVTPIGIAIAATEKPIEFINVTINEKLVRLFDVKALTVGDGLLAAGINFSKLYGKPGIGLMIKVNNQLITIPGKHGKPPMLTKNGEPTSLDAILSSNDVITVQKGEDGKRAEATIRDIIDEIPSIKLFINNEPFTLYASILKNGQPIQPTERVEERDEIEVLFPKTVEQVLQSLQQIDTINNLTPFTVFVNGKKTSLKQQNRKLLINGKEAQLSSLIKDGDRLTLPTTCEQLSVAHLLRALKMSTTTAIQVFYNDEPVTIEKTLVEVQREGKTLTEEEPIYREQEFTVIPLQTEPFIFQDVFRYVDVDLTTSTNKKLIIRKNGVNATFSEQINSGDRLEVRFIATETKSS